MPVKVVTRAQAKAKEGLRGEESKSERSLRAEKNQRYRRNKQQRKSEMRKLETKLHVNQSFKSFKENFQKSLR